MYLYILLFSSHNAFSALKINVINVEHFAFILFLFEHNFSDTCDKLSIKTVLIIG